MDCQASSPLIRASETHTTCLLEAEGAVTRLLCIRNINDEECAVYLRQIIKHIKMSIPSAVIYAEDASEQLKLGTDQPYKFDCRLTCVLVLGGDGTMLFAAGLFEEIESPPIFGIAKGNAPILYNFFFNKVESLEILVKAFIEQLKKGQLITENCERLEVKKVNSIDLKETHNKRVALSEITIHRGRNNSCVRMEIYIDGVFLTSCIGDGIIFATPYGSLAYSLSSNGPILSNKTNSITMVPVCPLSMSFRPICLPNSTVINIRIAEKSRALGTVTCDGFCSFELGKDEVLEIKKSNKRIRMVCGVGHQPTSSVWVSKLKSALNWGNEFSA